jgi:hypothetical protein
MQTLSDFLRDYSRALSSPRTLLRERARLVAALQVLSNEAKTADEVKQLFLRAVKILMYSPPSLGVKSREREG